MTNGLGSVRVLVNSDGVPTNSTVYDAWGTPRSDGDAPNPFGFTGEYQDVNARTDRAIALYLQGRVSQVDETVQYLRYALVGN